MSKTAPRLCQFGSFSCHSSQRIINLSKPPKLTNSAAVQNSTLNLDYLWRFLAIVTELTLQQASLCFLRSNLATFSNLLQGLKKKKEKTVRGGSGGGNSFSCLSRGSQRLNQCPGKTACGVETWKMVGNTMPGLVYCQDDTLYFYRQNKNTGQYISCGGGR